MVEQGRESTDSRNVLLTSLSRSETVREMDRERKVRTQAGVCPVFTTIPLPILFTCLHSLKGNLCVFMSEAVGRGSRKRGLPLPHLLFGDGKQTKASEKATRLSLLDHLTCSDTEQTCPLNSGLFFQCGFCYQSLKLEGRCPNCLKRNFVLTLNAAVSITPTNFLLFVMAGLRIYSNYCML